MEPNRANLSVRVQTQGGFAITCKFFFFFKLYAFIYLSIYKIYFIDYAITVVPIFLPLPFSAQYPPVPSSSPYPPSSCPWAMYISSLASPFPILFFFFLLLFKYSWQVLFNSPPSDAHEKGWEQWVGELRQAGSDWLPQQNSQETLFPLFEMFFHMKQSP